MDNEREWTTGLLSKEISFRLIVSGPIGVREIDRLIRKLELDKEILADESEERSAISRQNLAAQCSPFANASSLSCLLG